MKLGINPAIAFIALLFTASSSPMLLAQPAANKQPDKEEKDVLFVPAITVQSGKQALIQIDGAEYTVTPTILEGGLVEVRTVLLKASECASLASLNAVAATETNVLADRIERTIMLRAFERVVKEICQTEFEFYARPDPAGETNEQHLQRIALHNAKLTCLTEYRDRLRTEMQKKADQTAAEK